jgi:hypothetical protein
MSDIAATTSDLTPARFCPDCGYDLRGIASTRCPECGLAIDWTTPESPIPWTYRQRIGRLRALRKTMDLATFHPRKLATAIATPVDYPSAQCFRWIVIFLAAIPPIMFLVAAIIALGGTAFLSIVTDPPLTYSLSASPINFGWELRLIWSAGATLLPVLPIGILIAFILSTAAASGWFRPRSLPVFRQNRAVAISQYAAAPLAWLILPAVTIGTTVVLQVQGVTTSTPLWPLVELLIWVDGLALVLIPLLWWGNTLRLLAATTHCGAGRVAAASVTLPLLWIGSVVIGLGLFPLVIGFIWLMIDSLH